MIAHAALGQLFGIPVVITSSAERGPNGPVLKEIVDMFPDAPLVRRPGEVKYVLSVPMPYAYTPSSITRAYVSNRGSYSHC